MINTMATLKNIFIIIATVFLATACSSDILEDVPSTDNNNPNTEVAEDASLTIRIASEGVQTKAGETTEQLTESERDITSCVVAVFENTTEKYRIGYKYISNGINQNVTDGSFTVDDIRCKEGKAWVVVIANLTDAQAAELEGKYTYSEWNTFSTKGIDANRLIKYNRKKEYNLASGDNTVEIQLTQLAARIDITDITVTPPAADMDASFKMSSMTATISDFSYVLAPYSYQDNTTSYRAEYNTNNTHNITKDAYVSFYSYSVDSSVEGTEAYGFVKVTMTGTITTTTKEDVSESRDVTFSFNIYQKLSAGNLYRGSLTITSGLESVNLDLQTIPWEEKEIEVGLK